MSNIQDQNTFPCYVYQDTAPARLYHIPKSWFWKLGLLLGVFFLITLTSLLWALKIYWLSPPLETQETHALQKALAQANAQIATLKQQTFSIKDQTISIPTPPWHISEPYRQFPPLTLEHIQIKYHPQKLSIYFHLKYLRKDGGFQKGFLFIMAQGTNRILFYPPQGWKFQKNALALSRPKGEFFSVSRFRISNVTFSNPGNQLKKLFIFAFNFKKELIFQKTLLLRSTP